MLNRRLSPEGTPPADLSREDTWPRAVHAELRRIAQRLVGREGWDPADQHSPDLRWADPNTELEFDRWVRQQLDAGGVLMYHGTRLLEYEANDILGRGLLPLTDDLRREKLASAAVHYPEVLPDATVNWLLKHGPLSWGAGHEVRRGQISVVAPLIAFDLDDGLTPLLSHWGGESIAWAVKEHDDPRAPGVAALAQLDGLSSPAVVEIAVEATRLSEWTNLVPHMLGTILKMRDPWNEWRLYEAVPPSQVIEVIQPGSPRWRSVWGSTG